MRVDVRLVDDGKLTLQDLVRTAAKIRRGGSGSIHTRERCGRAPMPTSSSSIRPRRRSSGTPTSTARPTTRRSRDARPAVESSACCCGARPFPRTAASLPLPAAGSSSLKVEMHEPRRHHHGFDLVRQHPPEVLQCGADPGAAVACAGRHGLHARPADRQHPAL